MPYGEEAGSNGLAVDATGQLLICEHGDRRIAVLPLRGVGGKRTLTDNYQGKRYNSPNDVVVHSSGNIYFSDPPYGLPKKDADPTREISVSGVYRLAPNGAVTQEIKDLSSPNGLAFSPDSKTLYVSQSDSLKPLIRAYSVEADAHWGRTLVFRCVRRCPESNPKT